MGIVSTIYCVIGLIVFVVFFLKFIDTFVLSDVKKHTEGYDKRFGGQ